MTFPDRFIDLLVDISIFAGFVLIAGLLGGIFIKIFPFQLAVEVFAFFRFLLSFVDSFIHTPTLLTLLGISFSFMAFYWSYKALVFVVRFFNKQ